MAIAATPPLPDLASRYHAFGANVLAIRKDAKKPAHPWKRWQTQRQMETDVASLPWRLADRIGFINGINGVRSFDIDEIESGMRGLEPVWRILDALNLPDTYTWVERSASGAGWHIWFRCEDVMPPGALPMKEDSADDHERGIFWGESLDDSFDHIELRWESNQTIIASSDGTSRWLNGEPDSPPAKVGIDLVLAAFRSVAHVPERAKVAVTPATSPSPVTPRQSPPASNGVRDVREDIKAAFDMVAFAQEHFGREIQKEPGGEVRVLGNGGLLIKPGDGVWYRFSGEIGGDCFDLVGLALHGPVWNRHDKSMFADVLHRAGEYAGVPTEAVRVHGLHVLRDQVQASANEVQGDANTDSDSPWLRFLSGRESIWDAIVNGVEPPQYLVSPIVLDGMVTVIFGGPEQGKTWILLHCVLEAVRQGKKVLFLDEESGIRFIKERMQSLGFTKEDDAFVYYFAFKAEMTLEQLAEAILDGVIREQFALIVCDSISKLFAAASLEENSNTDATRLMRAWITPAAHVFGCAFLGIDHTVKVEEEGRYGRGAGSKLADVDVQWHIQASVPPSRTSRGRLVLTNKKDRTAWVPKTVRYLAGGDGAGGVQVALEHTSEVVMPAIRGKDQEVIAVLYGGLNSGKRMSEWQAAARDSGISDRTVINSAHRLMEQNIVGKNGDLYYVTAQGASWCNLGASAELHLEQDGGGGVQLPVSKPPYGGLHRVAPPSDVPAPSDSAPNDISNGDLDEEWIDGKPPF
jgi:hypothetical protein